MTPDETDEMIIGLINVIERKNILMVYEEDAHMPEVMYCLISRILDMHQMPLVWVCWNETSDGVKKRLEISGCREVIANIIDTVSNTVTDDRTVLYNKKNFSGILMEIQNYTMNKEHIAVLDNLNIMGIMENKEAFIRFLSTLLRKSKNSAGTVFASLSTNLLEPNMQKVLLSLYDTIFYLGNDTIKIKNSSGDEKIFYEIKNNTLILKPFPSADVARIKEIFDISSEETKLLDEIVEKEMKLHKEILD